MTLQDEAEVRRTSVGTKVLIFGFAILAVLGSFWTIVWFIRSYVEPPRVGIPLSMTLAARESTPVVPPAPTVAPAPMGTADPKPANVAPEPVQKAAESQPATPPQAAAPAEPPSVAGAVADRWLPMTQGAPALPAAEPAPAPEPPTAPAVAAAPPDADPPVEEVAEGSVPAIAGRAPLPRRKPTLASAAKRMDPPLPRPRPDGPAPQSVWTAVPVSDERFPTQ